MANPSPFSTFDGFSASEIFVMQSGIPRQGSRPIASCNNDRLVPVLACPEHARPSASPFHPFPDTLNREKGKGLPSRCRPSRQVRRDWPQRIAQARPLQPYQSHQPRQRPPSQRPPVLCPGQQPPVRHLTIPTQSRPWQGFDEPFPFKREYIRRIFRSLSEMPDFQLPVQVRPDQAGFDSHPYYCPYHQVMGHALEDCLTFKEWLRGAITEGSVVLPAAYLADPPASSESCADNSTGSWAGSEDV